MYKKLMKFFTLFGPIHLEPERLLEILLYRVCTNEQGTLGYLSYNGKVICWTLERQWCDNKQNRSCIPADSYMVSHVPVTASGKYKDVYRILNVSDRSGILIHKGNWAGATHMGYKSDTTGCILVGLYPSKMLGQMSVSHSAKAIKKLHNLVGRNSFKLKVINYYET